MIMFYILGGVYVKYKKTREKYLKISKNIDKELISFFEEISKTKLESIFYSKEFSQDDKIYEIKIPYILQSSGLKSYRIWFSEPEIRLSDIFIEIDYGCFEIRKTIEIYSLEDLNKQIKKEIRFIKKIMKQIVIFEN